MKLIRWLLAFVGFIVVLVFMLNLIGNRLLSSVIGEVLGTQVGIKKLQIDLKEQQLGIYDLKIENLEDYREPTIVVIPEIFVDLRFADLLKKKWTIEEIRLNLGEVTVERNTKGEFNLVQLKPVREMVKGTEKEKVSEEKDARIGFLMKFETHIEEVTLSVGRGRYVDSSSGEIVVREFPLNIRNVKFYDIQSMPQLAREVIMKIMAKIGMNALVPDWDQFSAAFEPQFSAKINDVKNGVADFVDKIKNALNNK